MRRFLAIFYCMGAVGFFFSSEGATTLGYKTNNPGNPRLQVQDAEAVKAKRGKLLVKYLEDGKITCQTLWDDKEKGRDVIGTFDYDLVKTYCSARTRWVQVDSSGHQWDKRNWKRVFEKEPVKTRPIAQQESLGQPVLGSSHPRLSPQRSISAPPQSQVAHRHTSFPVGEEEEDDSGVGEDEWDEVTFHGSGHGKVTPRSSQPFRPVVWGGGTREAGNAYAKIESVYETTKDHIEEMHAKWEELEDHRCDGNAACLSRLKKSKTDLENHIKGLEKYIDSLERHNNFLLKALEGHLAEDRRALSRQDVQQLHAYLKDLEEQHRDLEERIKALRIEAEALIDSLDGKASHQKTEEIYERAARAGKRKATGSLGSQGPLKVKETLDSLKAEVEAYQREGRALWAGIPRATSHVCVGTECDQLRSTLSHAQTYEGEIEDLEKRIAVLRARVADVQTPNSAAKASSERQIVALQARVKELEVENKRSEIALRAALGRTQDSVVTVTPRGSVDLVVQQGNLVTQVAAAQKTEKALREEIAAVQTQVARGQVTVQQAEQRRADLDEELKQSQAVAEVLRKKNEELEKALKKQLMTGKFVSAVQRTRAQEAQAANKTLTAQLVVLGENQKSDLAELRHKLADSEAARDTAVREATAAHQLTAEQQRKIDAFEAQIKSLEEAAKREKERAEKEEARATGLEEELRGTVARTRNEKQDTSALERRVAQAEESAREHQKQSQRLVDEAQEKVTQKDREISELKARKSQLAWQKFISAFRERKRLEKIGRATGTLSLANELGGDQVSQSLAEQTTAILKAIEDQKTAFAAQEAQLGILREDLAGQHQTIAQLLADNERLKSLERRAETLQQEVLAQHSHTPTDTRGLEGRIKELESLLKQISEERDQATRKALRGKESVKHMGDKLRSQEEEMKAREADREKLEETLQDQQRQLQSQLAELKKLRESQGSDDSAEGMLQEKQKEIRKLKNKIDEMVEQSRIRRPKIDKDRQELAKLIQENEKQKEIIATAVLVTQQFQTENEGLKGKNNRLLDLLRTIDREMREKAEKQRQLATSTKPDLNLQARIQAAQERVAQRERVTAERVAKKEQEQA